MAGVVVPVRTGEVRLNFFKQGGLRLTYRRGKEGGKDNQPKELTRASKDSKSKKQERILLEGKPVHE